MTNTELRTLRQAAKLSQERAAEALGLSPRHYKRLEAGTIDIRESVARLAALSLRGN